MLGGQLFSVLRTLLALAGVCALAWLVLSLLARRGVGLGLRGGSARLQVLERVTLSPRRQVYLVRADQRLFLLGAGEAGAISLIAELAADPTRTALAAASTDVSTTTRVEP